MSESGTMLGIARLNDKESLSKLKKEQLIECILSEVKAKDELIDKIVNSSAEELIEFQKEIRFYKGISKMLGF